MICTMLSAEQGFFIRNKTRMKKAFLFVFRPNYDESGMFNKSYHQRARRQVRQAGGGHKVAEDALLRLPWAGIFEPWRPFVAVAAANRRKNRAHHLQDKPQGVQLELFADNDAQKFTPPSKIDRGVKNFARDPERPLFDLFPEAYV
jgi:hypothetical protein